jgi:hypothetical protein
MTKVPVARKPAALELHPEYANLLGGAHKRRVTPIGSPALVRHLAFWNPISWVEEEPAPGTVAETGPETGSETEPGCAWGSDLRSRKSDRVIAAVYRALKHPKTPNHVQDVTIGEIHEVGAAKLATLFCSVLDVSSGNIVKGDGGLKPDKYSAIKVTFLWHGIWVTLNFENHTEFLTCRATLDLSRTRLAGREKAETNSAVAYNRLCGCLTKLAESSALAEADCTDIYAAVYRDIWDVFEEDVLYPLLRLQRYIGATFADFRGFTLRAAAPATTGSGDDAQAPGKFTAPFQRKEDDDSFNPKRRSNCEMGRVGDIWPLLKCEKGKNVEFTVSEFLDGHAIYVTALGEQSGCDLTRPDPLHYFIYEDTINTWQLGRLIERINTLGTLRLAALMHFDRMRAMEGELLAVERSIATALSSARRTSPADLESAQSLMGKLWGDYTTVQKSLSPFHKVDPIDPLNGGLEYRVDRSRYYQGQFTRSLDWLRIGRVEGFQPYDEFVKRRLGGAFDFIDRLGHQFARMQADLVTLFQYSQTLRSLEMEIDIRTRNDQIAETQITADLILFAVLIPYYASAIIGHTLELADAGKVVVSFIFVAAIAAGLFQYISRGFQLNKREKNRAVLWVGLAISSLGAMVWVLVWLLPSVSQSAAVPAQTRTNSSATIPASPQSSQQIQRTPATRH